LVHITWDNILIYSILSYFDVHNFMDAVNRFIGTSCSCRSFKGGKSGVVPPLIFLEDVHDDLLISRLFYTSVNLCCYFVGF